MQQLGLFSVPEDTASDAVMAFWQPDGRIIQASDEKCDCGQERCEHTAWVMDAQEGAHNVRHTAKSGLHKEIRRGDVQKALMWARLVAKFCGEQEVKAYCRKILFEETRNLTLFEKWQDTRKLGFEEMVCSLAASKKKWQLSARYGLFLTYLSACARLESEKAVLGDPFRVFSESSSPETLFDAFWRVRKFGDEGDYLKIRAALRWRFTGHPVGEVVADGKWFDAWYPIKVLIEIACNGWSEDANSFLSGTVLTQDPPRMVPPMPDYVFDNHTRAGLGVYMRHLGELQPGKPQPAGMDVRYSGMVRAVLWRHQVCLEGLPQCRWEDATPPAQAWADACATDRFFYPNL